MLKSGATENPTIPIMYTTKNKKQHTGQNWLYKGLLILVGNKN